MSSLLKRLHRVEYDEYIALKDRGDSRPIIPIEQGKNYK